MIADSTSRPCSSGAERVAPGAPPPSTPAAGRGVHESSSVATSLVLCAAPSHGAKERRDEAHHGDDEGDHRHRARCGSSRRRRCRGTGGVDPRRGRRNRRRWRHLALGRGVVAGHRAALSGPASRCRAAGADRWRSTADSTMRLMTTKMNATRHRYAAITGNVDELDSPGGTEKPHPRPLEDRLGDDGERDERTDLESGDRDSPAPACSLQRVAEIHRARLVRPRARANLM